MAVSGRTLFEYIEIKTAGFLSELRRNTAYIYASMIRAFINVEVKNQMLYTRFYFYPIAQVFVFELKTPYRANPGKIELFEKRSTAPLLLKSGNGADL